MSPAPRLARHAKDFLRCAIQRFDDAATLLEAERTTAAVYLAGYGVECALKALVLATMPFPEQAVYVREVFRGADGHSYETLRIAYRQRGGAAIPVAVARHLATVDSWSTDLRYDPSSHWYRDARAFLASTHEIIAWAKGRL